jgi:hypothetical protein
MLRVDAVPQDLTQRAQLQRRVRLRALAREERAQLGHRQPIDARVTELLADRLEPLAQRPDSRRVSRVGA